MKPLPWLPSERNLELEVLRGIAILMMLVAHLGILLPFHDDRLTMLVLRQYFFGSSLDIFFVMSGFVISKAFMDFFDALTERGRLGLALKAFWVRRAWRLFPTAWLWVVVGLLASLLFNSSGMFASVRENIISLVAVLSFTGNVANIDMAGNLLGPNPQYWSLALEEQFYLLFPLFLLLYRGRARWMLALALIAVHIPMNRYPFSGQDLHQLWFVIRVDGFLWGICIFIFSRTPLHARLTLMARRIPWPLMLAFAVGLLYLVGWVPARYFEHVWAFSAVAIIAAVLILICSFDSGTFTRIPLVSPMLLWFGTRSYAMYVIHLFAYRMSYEIWYRISGQRGMQLDEQFTLELFATAMLLLAALSALNYRFVEEPARLYGARRSREIIARDAQRAQAASDLTSSPQARTLTALHTGKKS